MESFQGSQAEATKLRIDYLSGLKVGILIFIAIAVAMLNSQNRQLAQYTESQISPTHSTLLTNQVPRGAPESVRAIDTETLLKIKVGQHFNFRAESDSEEIILDFEVGGIDVYPGFKQFTGRSTDGEVVITVSKTLTNIFVQTDIGIFEYVGDNFAGVVQKVIETNLHNDVYPLNASTPISPTKVKAKKLSAPSFE